MQVPVKCWKLCVEMLRTFLRSMDVKVGKLNVTKPVLQLQLLQWYNGTAVRDVMSSKKKKKGAKSTKPPAVTQDGTYYRVINTILHPEMKPTYMKTGDVLDRAALDAKIGHKGAWTVLHEFYKNEEKSDLGLMAEPKFASTYASWNVKNDTPSKFDKLDIDEFTATVEFVNHHYKLAKRSNEQSGNHDDFQNYVEGKHWLLFYFAKLLELGDTDLDNLVSPALNDEVFLSSGTMQRSTEQNSKRFKMSAGDKKGMVTSQRAALELAVERSKLVTEVLENANKASQNDRLRELISLAECMLHHQPCRVQEEDYPLLPSVLLQIRMPHCHLSYQDQLHRSKETEDPNHKQLDSSNRIVCNDQRSTPIHYL